MADGVLFDMAGKLLEMLGPHVFQEIALAWGVKDDATKLKETIRSIKAVLLDAEKQHRKKNELVTEWLRRLKDVFYEADDVLDDFSTELMKREMMTGNKLAKEVRIFFSNSNQIAYGLKMAHKIKAVRGKLDYIAKDMAQFHFIEHQFENPILNTKRETYSFELVTNVVGRDDDKNKIIQLLLDSNYDYDGDVSVISIVGIGGLGKTTLARLVYNDEKVKHHFDLKMWTCVSNEFNVETIVKNILKSIDAEEIGFENLNFEQLLQRLRKKINGKKYLLVLDDIWNENREKWLQLKTILVNDVKGSNILVITRSKQVAKITSKPFLIHDLESLNEDESWSLFTKMAFEDGIEPKGSNLVEIGKRIVARCVGVPLAVRTIGRLLYENNTESYWLHLMEDEMMNIHKQEESDIIPTLKLSYDHLPPQLKQCFAYCSLFPKDYVINKESLIYLWMAQGFLQSATASQSLEDVGNEYFINLVSRSFFQDVTYDKRFMVMTCKMHDLMHDLATLVAKPECILAKLDARNVDERTYHVSFDSKLKSSWNISSALVRANHLRTFILHNGPYRYMNDLNESNCKKVFSSFKCLRTLDLSASKIKYVPNSIGKLKHLRYLDLSYNFVLKKFPNSITKLGNLQVLKLNGCIELKKLTKDITKLVNLRCLEIDECYELVGTPRRLSQLTSLRSLSLFKLGKKDGNFSDLSELNQLIINLRGRLEIRRLENATSKPTLSNLKAAQHIQSLLFGWTPFESGERECDDLVLESLEPHQHLKYLFMQGFKGVRIPNWLSTLRNLIEIQITGCNYCRHLPAVDQLPSLKRLTLFSMGLEYISDASSTIPMSFFPSLEELAISSCENLKGWWRDDGDIMQLEDLPSFPCLSHLMIDYCPNLASMPLCPSLEDLKICYSSLKPMEKMMKMMSNVPSSSSSTSAGLLSRLKSLSIRNPDKLDLLTEEYDKHWEALTSLRFIELAELGELVSLPKGFQRVTGLKSLEIRGCNNLTVLTEGMQLQYLTIEDCPKLSVKCGSNMGVDWPKISHIPNVKVDEKWIQKDGCYQLNSEEQASTSSATEA